MAFYITKASGEKELFSADKLKNSLSRAGASEAITDEIISHILREAGKFRTTYDLYRHAFSYLRKKERPTAARYNLRMAIMQLGPEGFLFERLVGELLKAQGYEVKVDQIIEGRCVKHEVDVIAEKEGEHFLVECKFHNQPGIRSDVKTALYVKARADDIEAGLREKDHAQKFHQAWLVTNTKFTSDAIQYGECAGLKMLGWAYPQNKGLEVLISQLKAYPVTTLISLGPKQKEFLLSRGVILCRDLEDSPRYFKEMKLSPAKLAQVIEELHQLI